MKVKGAWESSWVTGTGGVGGVLLLQHPKVPPCKLLPPLAQRDSCKQITSVAMCSAEIILAGRRAGRRTPHYPFSYLSLRSIPFTPAPSALRSCPSLPPSILPACRPGWSSGQRVYPSTPTHPSHNLLSSCLSTEGRFAGEGSELHLEPMITFILLIRLLNSHFLIIICH